MAPRGLKHPTPTFRQPSGRETDSLEQAARRAQAAACVNSHPTFGKSFRQEAPAKIARHQPTPYLVHVIKAIDAEQDGSPPEPSGAVGPEQSRRAASGDPVEGLSHNENSGQSPAPSAVENPQSAIQNPQSEVPLLTLEEKRRILARIARVNPLDCFDESGAFDIVRAKRILPPGAIRHIAVHETTRLNAEGQPVTQRRIHVRLVDPVSALRLDDLMERRRERPASHSTSTSKNFTRRDFNLLTEKTMALEDANHSIELLEKTLAEADDFELQLSKELEEKDHQLSQTLSLSNGLQTLSLSNGSETLSLSNGSQTLSKVEGDAAQRDTGCQPVQKKPETSTASQPVEPKSPTQSETLNSSGVPSQVLHPSSTALQSRDQSREAGFSTPLSENSKAQNASKPSLPNPEQSTQSTTDHHPNPPKLQNPSAPQNPNAVKTWLPGGLQWPQHLSSAEKRTLENLDEIEIRIRKQEIEDVRSTSGPGAFRAWFRAWSWEVANDRSPAARRSPRPPPKLNPMSFSAQGRPKFV